MSLHTLAHYFESYPSLAIFPLGKKNKNVRSIGHKTERALFGRIQEALNVIECKETDLKLIQDFLSLKGEAFFPVFINRDEHLYPHFMKPEAFLWTEFNSDNGVPLHENGFYKENVTFMPREELLDHMKRVVNDYVFAAVLSEKTREEWESLLASSFRQHPFVRLAEKKKSVIEATEKMNRSSLLSLLTPPEEAAFWRQRVEIVMRPYRMLPDVCAHPKEMSFHSKERTMTVRCEFCKFSLTYYVEEDRTVLEEEPDMEKATKRIATIERQFNELASKNEGLLKGLKELIHWKKHLVNLPEAIEWRRKILMRPPIKLQEDSFSKLMEDLYLSKIPVARPDSELLWLSEFDLASLSLLKEIKSLSLKEAEQLLNQLIERLQSDYEELSYQPDDPVIQLKDKTLTYRVISLLMEGLNGPLKDQPLHTLAQVLKGRTSNRLRENEMDKMDIFGILEDWEEKDIQKAFKRIEKEGWIKKEAVGYTGNAAK